MTLCMHLKIEKITKQPKITMRLFRIKTRNVPCNSTQNLLREPAYALLQSAGETLH